MSGGLTPAAGALWVVVPVYNEGSAVESVLREWTTAVDVSVPDAILCVVDDGSSDETPAVLARLAASLPGLRVLAQANAGHGQACLSGYRAALEGGAGWVLQIDSDGQCDPQYFEAVWKKRTEHASIFGKRVDRDDGAARKVISWFCRVATHIATGVPVRDPNVPYRLMRADVLKPAIADFPQDFGLSNILVSVVLQKGLGPKMGFVPIGFRDRTGGEPSVKWMKFVTEGWKLYSALMTKRPYISARAAEVAKAAG